MQLDDEMCKTGGIQARIRYVDLPYVPAALIFHPSQAIVVNVRIEPRQPLTKLAQLRMVVVVVFILRDEPLHFGRFIQLPRLNQIAVTREPLAFVMQPPAIGDVPEP